MTEHLTHISRLHDFSSPVMFQHCVFNNDRYSSQDEGQEEVSVNVVSGAMQFPAKEHRVIQFQIACI